MRKKSIHVDFSFLENYYWDGTWIQIL
eukprot:COSAG01_NODE_35369_length_533_cov_0.476959_2_plen_26_part_01